MRLRFDRSRPDGWEGVMPRDWQMYEGTQHKQSRRQQRPARENPRKDKNGSKK